MMKTNFNSLSFAKQTAINIIVSTIPEIMTSGVVSLKQLKSIWNKNSNFVVGFPSWITSKENRAEKKGVYYIPLPDKLPTNLHFEKECDTIKYKNYTPETFSAELKKHGINL